LLSFHALCLTAASSTGLGDPPPRCNREPIAVKQGCKTPRGRPRGALLLYMRSWCTFGIGVGTSAGLSYLILLY